MGPCKRAGLLAQILALNFAVARRIQAGEPVTAPGVPPSYPTPAKLVTQDCSNRPRCPDLFSSRRDARGRRRPMPYLDAVIAGRPEADAANSGRLSERVILKHAPEGSP